MTGLPAGFFVVNAKAQFERVPDSGSTDVRCTLTAEDATNATGPFLDGAGGSLIIEDRTTLPLATVADLPSGGVAVLNCIGNNVLVSNVTLVAIQVGTLTVTR